MIAIMSHEIIDLLARRANNRLKLVKGSYLFRQGDAVKSIFVIESGLVELTRHQHDGRLVVLQRATRQMIVAEASVYSDACHYDAIAGLASDVVAISKNNLKCLLLHDETFSRKWAEYLAKEVQAARRLIEILSKKSVAERLDGWLAWRENEPVSKGQWKNIAAQIGVSPEALYRELAKRRLK
jgi:CRP-like cAMP-binding protein